MMLERDLSNSASAWIRRNNLCNSPLKKSLCENGIPLLKKFIPLCIFSHVTWKNVLFRFCFCLTDEKKELVPSLGLFYVQQQWFIFHWDTSASGGAFIAMGEDIICRYGDLRLKRIQWCFWKWRAGKGKWRDDNLLSSHLKSSKGLVQALPLLHILSRMFCVHLRKSAFHTHSSYPLSFWLLTQ